MDNVATTRTATWENDPSQERSGPTPTFAQRLAERRRLPDPLVRFGIRRLLRGRLAEECGASTAACEERQAAFRSALARGPIAVATDRANDQHYEVQAAFYREVLGPRLKYSSGYWPEEVTGLAAAEDAMLGLTCRRAGIEDGMEILDLGCGWGSLSLWLAEHYPRAKIVALSNSRGQREAIEAKVRLRGLPPIEVVTANVSSFDTDRRFDRVVSVEMFEHMRNWEALLARIAGWLRPDGRLFVHTFSHRSLAYPFETARDDDWMGRTFFTGGIMPSVDTISWFDRHLVTEEQWRVNGVHYAKTARAWLDNLDRRRASILPILAECYGADGAALWHGRWRLFFMACEELFRFRGGAEWLVTHTLLRPRP